MNIKQLYSVILLSISFAFADINLEDELTLSVKVPVADFKKFKNILEQDQNKFFVYPAFILFYDYHSTVTNANTLSNLLAFYEIRDIEIQSHEAKILTTAKSNFTRALADIISYNIMAWITKVAENKLIPSLPYYKTSDAINFAETRFVTQSVAKEATYTKQTMHLGSSIITNLLHVYSKGKFTNLQANNEFTDEFNNPLNPAFENVALKTISYITPLFSYANINKAYNLYNLVNTGKTHSATITLYNSINFSYTPWVSCWHDINNSYIILEHYIRYKNIGFQVLTGVGTNKNKFFVIDYVPIVVGLNTSDIVINHELSVYFNSKLFFDGTIEFQDRKLVNMFGLNIDYDLELGIKFDFNGAIGKLSISYSGFEYKEFNGLSINFELGNQY